MKTLFFLACLLPYVSLLHSTSENTHYTAAVVEYSPEDTGVENHILNYEKLIADAKSQGADIIVFPENGLKEKTYGEEGPYYGVPNPRDSVCPCLRPGKSTDPIWRISCAARNHQIYVAINAGEQNGSKRHNTNIVFDRNGVVVSRYRKLHLFHEPEYQVPDEIDYGVFETDFGVTFGVAICFDLLFREPASELVHTRDIRHFVYSSAWYSERPFLTAIQTQAAWAWSHNSVLLASGFNGPKNGNTGSGIHIGRMGSNTAFITGEKTTRLLVSPVPKKIEVNDKFLFARTKPDVPRFRNSFKNLGLFKDHLNAFTSQLLPLGHIHEDIKLCHYQFCCQFNIRTEPKDTTSPETEAAWEPYRLFVWDGVRDFGGAATGGVQFCAVVACRDMDDVRSCGRLISDNQFRSVQFTKLEIRGTFEEDNTMILANTMNHSLLPLPGDAFVLSEGEADCDGTGNVKCLNMELTKKQEDIHTFAIYSRVFGRDSSKPTHFMPRRRFNFP